MSSGTKRTNSAMGTGQTPPQNVICLLLGWTVLANKAEPIPSPLQHTHPHPFFSPAILQGTSQGRSEWEVGVREGSISVLRKARSLFPSAPPSSSEAHSPKKRAPKWNFSLILPPFSSLVPPAGGLDSTRNPRPPSGLL